MAELLACFPVYRSYLPEGRAHLDEAFDLAGAHRPDLAGTLDALRPVLSDPASPPALRFQQTSGMVMAKGVEDCAFYRWSRLTSLNEVGAEPAIFSITPGEFHEQMAVRQADWPDSVTARRRKPAMATTSSNVSGNMKTMAAAETRHKVHQVPIITG